MKWSLCHIPRQCGAASSSRTVLPVPLLKAPLLRRVAAYLFDVGLFLLPGATTSYLVLSDSMRSALVELVLMKRFELSAFGFSPRAALTGTLPTRTLLFVVTAGAWLLGWLWYRIRTVMDNSSLGKRLFGIELVSLHQGDLEMPVKRGATLKQSIRRLTPGVALGVLPIPGTGLLGYAAALLDASGRGWHDKAAGTMVVLRMVPDDQLGCDAGLATEDSASRG